MFFQNRCDAGRRLARQLEPLRDGHPIVIGVARGGVPVAYEVATALEAPLDALVTRKLGAPGQPEFAIGALAPGVHVLDDASIRLLHIPRSYVDSVIKREQREVETRLALYRGERPPVDVAGHPVILVDDGIATGSTARAAVRSVRGMGARQVTVAVPVCSREARARLREEADDVISLSTPDDFWAVGYYYEDFTPTSDQEVIALLKRAALEREARFHHEVES